MSSKEITLNKFLLSVKQCYSDMDAARTPWPANAFQMESYFCDIIATTIFDKFKENPKKCEKALSALSVFTLYSALHHGEIVGLKVGKVFDNYPKNQEDILNFTFFIFKIIKSKIQKDIFCLNGTHRILTIEEIKKTQEQIETKDQKIKKEIASLIVSLESLIWALYFDFSVCAGSEKHGPYLADKKNVILVRNYFDLSPKEIWSTDNKYPSVKMYLKYPENVGIKINSNNQIKSSKPLGDELISFSIYVGKKKITSLSEIRSLSQYFSHLTEKQAKKVNVLSPLEIIKKGAEIYYYRYKKFFEYYGEDWHPPQQVYDRINGLKLRWWKYYQNNENRKKSPSNYVKLLDPRNDFIG